MKPSKSVFRTAAKFLFFLLLALSVQGMSPARAQVMHQDGFQIPWFHTRAEKLARQACEDDLPECRDSVRQQLAVEHTITNLAPWVLICLVILGAVIYVRRQEFVREKLRHEAQRHHVQAATTKRARGGRDDARAGRDDPQDDADDLDVGHPGDR
jgi:hypothetical protein